MVPVNALGTIQKQSSLGDGKNLQLWGINWEFFPWAYWSISGLWVPCCWILRGIFKGKYRNPAAYRLAQTQLHLPKSFKRKTVQLELKKQQLFPRWDGKSKCNLESRRTFFSGRLPPILSGFPDSSGYACVRAQTRRPSGFWLRQSLYCTF